MTNDEVAQIRARLDGITSGQWERRVEAIEDEYGSEEVYIVSAVQRQDVIDIADIRSSRSDADFIAHAPSDIQSLLLEVTRLQGKG